jgi:hypothetical protein
VSGTHRIFAPIGALAILAFAPAAAARAPKPYVRKRPAREHCKRHYVRAIKRVKVRRHGKRVRVRQVWCVYKGSIRAPAESLGPTTPPPPGLIPTYTVVSGSGLQGTAPQHLNVSGSIYYGRPLPGQLKELTGQPITSTIKDGTTGQLMGSFVLSSGPGSCSVAYRVEGGMQVLNGEAVPPYPACALGTITAPAGHTVVFSGSFAGNATYAPSMSEQKPLYF